MTLPRTTGRPNHHHQAHCEPTLALMESIAATVPDAVLQAKRAAWDHGARHALSGLSIHPDSWPEFLQDNPYGPVV